MALDDNLNTVTLNPSQFNLIDRSNKKTDEILKNNPSLVVRIICDYMDGEFTENIAEKYFQSEYRRNRKFASRIIYLILKKRLTEKKREKLRKEHWRKSLKYSYLNGKLDKNRTKRREDSQRGSIIKNQIPWYDLPDREDFISGKFEIFTPEIAYAYNLYLDRYSYIEIARTLNEFYHNGEKVRNENSAQKSVRRFIKRYIESNKS